MGFKTLSLDLWFMVPWKQLTQCWPTNQLPVKPQVSLSFIG